MIPIYPLTPLNTICCKVKLDETKYKKKIKIKNRYQEQIELSIDIMKDFCKILKILLDS